MTPMSTLPGPLRLVCLSTNAAVQTALRDGVENDGDTTAAAPHLVLDFADPAAPDPDLLAQADGLLCGALTPQVRAAAPRLRWIQLWSADLEESAKGGNSVPICTAGGLDAAACAEHVDALLQAFARGDHRAPAAALAPFALAGKTVGVVGAGAVGQAVGARCQALGMQTVGLRRDVTRPTPGIDVLLPHLRYHDLLLASDIIVLALPLTPNTRLMFGEDEIEIIRKSAYVINLGRRGLIDETWLLRALQKNWIAGAGFDVFDDEPLPPDAPFRGLPNGVVTPHVAGHTPLFWPCFARFVREQAGRLLRGEPLANHINVHQPP